MDQAAGKQLLDELTAVATAPGMSYAHNWRSGDVVMWDNRATMHPRAAVAGPTKRGSWCVRQSLRPMPMALASMRFQPGQAAELAAPHIVIAVPAPGRLRSGSTPPGGPHRPSRSSGVSTLQRSIT